MIPRRETIAREPGAAASKNDANPRQAFDVKRTNPPETQAQAAKCEMLPRGLCLARGPGGRHLAPARVHEENMK